MNNKNVFLALIIVMCSTIAITAPSSSKKSSSAKSKKAVSGSINTSSAKTVVQTDVVDSKPQNNGASSSSKSVTQSSWQEVDSIKAVIYSEGDSEIITASEVSRPSVAGQMRTLDDIIFEYLVFLDAKRHKIMTDDASVDRYLAAIQKEHNLKPEQLKQIFSQAGYSFEEGKAQLKMIQATNAMLDFKIRSNLIVPRRQIRDYFDSHPELEEAAYQLQTGFIAHQPGQNKNQEREAVEAFAKAVSGSTVTGDAHDATAGFDVKWSNDFWVNKSDIAADQRFIYTMQPGQVVLAQETPDGYIMYRLKAHKEERLRSFDDRYVEIADILRKPRYEELLKEYREYLYKNAAIVTF